MNTTIHAHTTRTVLNQIVDAPLHVTKVLADAKKDPSNGTLHSFPDEATIVVALRMQW